MHPSYSPAIIKPVGRAGIFLTRSLSTSVNTNLEFIAPYITKCEGKTISMKNILKGVEQMEDHGCTASLALLQ